MGNGKCIIVGVSGGIAAYKTCEVVSRLKKLGYVPKVVMTKNATEFVAPLTFETLSGNRVTVDTFAPKVVYEVEHISLAKEGKLFLIAPATANVIAKLASGIADDFLTTTFMASKAVKVICPAMNCNMYDAEVTQKNLEKLKEQGCLILEPNVGLLACGDVGKGRMAEPAEITEYVDRLLTPNCDFRGKRVLITAGGTREPIDFVRYIGNRSSGKMGVAIAEAVLDRGGEVTLVTGTVAVSVPKCVKRVEVETTEEMYDAVMKELPYCDAVIKAAAPSDYKVKNYSPSKIKAEKLTLELEKTVDIAKEVGKIKGDKKLVVFAAETDDLIANAQKKIASKNADLMVANDVTAEGAGFGVDTNVVTLIKPDGEMKHLPQMIKREVADAILDEIR